jgi:hypothetical protein
MTPQIPSLSKMSYYERRAQLAKLRKRSASFRAFYWRMEGLRVLASGLLAGLIFFSFKEALGFWVIGVMLLATVIVEMILSAKFVLPRADLEQARLAAQGGHSII